MAVRDFLENKKIRLPHEGQDDEPPTLRSAARSWLFLPEPLDRRERPPALRRARLLTWILIAVIFAGLPSLGPERFLGSLSCLFVFLPMSLLIERFAPYQAVDRWHAFVALLASTTFVVLLPPTLAPAATASAVSLVVNSRHFGRLRYLLVAVVAGSFAAIGSIHGTPHWELIAAGVMIVPISGIQLVSWYSRQIESIASRIQLIATSSNAVLWEYNQETMRYENFEGDVQNLFGCSPNNLGTIFNNSSDLFDLVARTKVEESETAVIKLGCPGNPPSWFRFTTLGKVAANGERFIQGFALDVTELEGSRQSLRERTERDSLTGLHNRDGLVSFLEKYEPAYDSDEAHRSTISTAIFMIDVDRFKDINDTLGHLVGDKVIVALGNRFSRLANETLCVARLGGDEFAIALLADEASIEPKASLLAQNLLDLSRTNLAIDELELATSVSVGYSMSTKLGWEELLKQADIAMYEAKRSGQGIGAFSETNRLLSGTRLGLQAELANCLEDQIELWFQPIIDAQTLEVASIEGLARWVRPANEIVFPNEFLNLIESAGLTTRFDRHVLNAAAHAAAQLDILQQPISVSANISARSLWSTDLSRQLQSLAAVERSHLTIEITEQGLLDDHVRIAPTLTTFRFLGFKLSLDDYGTGASSLIRLRNLPFTQIKIDQSFVKGISEDGADRSIVRSSLALARELGLQTVAEGVETAQQAELLIEWGCDRLQGFFFAEAVPFDELDLQRRSLDPRVSGETGQPSSLLEPQRRP